MLFAVFGASKLSLREARPGMTANELCEMVQDYFGKYSKYWIYGLGHGVGLNVHEYPSLMLGSNHILENSHEHRNHILLNNGLSVFRSSLSHLKLSNLNK